MAGQGFKDFTVGEVLTSADVDGYLMQQSVMRFADSAARGSALGTAVGTAVPLAEGMLSYLSDTDAVEVYDGSAWVGVGGGFTASTAITVTDASWTVPTLADPVVRVTVVGGGGGGGSGTNGNNGGNGSSSSFGAYGTAAGGVGGLSSGNGAGQTVADGFCSWNGGDFGTRDSANDSGHPGLGGEVLVVYADLTGVSTVAVTVGAGGTGGVAGSGDAGSDGGDGVVIVEYRAG